MRLPLVIPLDARASSLAKDARMTNTVAEDYNGRKTLSARPALSQLATLDGAAGGVVCFDGALVAVAGTKLYEGLGVDTGETLVAGQYDFARGLT